MGLRTDGTVIAVGWNDYGQCDVDNWTDIVQVAAGGVHTVGLKVHGTVVTAYIGDENLLTEWILESVVPPNWPLIGGIIAAVVAGLTIFFELRSRHA